MRAGKIQGWTAGLRSAARAALLAALAVSCREGDMHDQPRYKPLAVSEFFADGRASRPLVAGTVARGQLRLDAHFYAGQVGAALAENFPFPITRDDMQRGQERFNIFCAPCHSRVGDGNGMIVQRGFPQPPSFHIDRLRQAPVGHFFQVISNGLGAMPDYAAQIPPRDRWLIVAYVRALQLSQRASFTELSASLRAELAEGPR
ncbi:MAG TPA: cytochrome c [Phycisphaerae bacterium]